MLILVDLFFDFQDCQICSFSLAVWFLVAETGSHRSTCDPLGSSHRLHPKCWNTDVGMHIFSSSGSGCLFCFMSFTLLSTCRYCTLFFCTNTNLAPGEFLKVFYKHLLFGFCLFLLLFSSPSHCRLFFFFSSPFKMWCWYIRLSS